MLSGGRVVIIIWVDITRARRVVPFRRHGRNSYSYAARDEAVTRWNNYQTLKSGRGENRVGFSCEPLCSSAVWTWSRFITAQHTRNNPKPPQRLLYAGAESRAQDVPLRYSKKKQSPSVRNQHNPRLHFSRKIALTFHFDDKTNLCTTIWYCRETRVYFHERIVARIADNYSARIRTNQRVEMNRITKLKRPL